MKSTLRLTVFLLISGVVLTGAMVFRAPVFGSARADGTPVFLVTIPSGYRDWRLVSVAHEEGNLHSFAAMLGNDIAIKAFRDGTLPYPDGTIIAALHYAHLPSAENDKVFGDPQSFVPGPSTNVQFMVKDSKKYAATGGWGFGHFNADGTSGTEAQLKTCFPCHAMATRDFIFTKYSP